MVDKLHIVIAYLEVRFVPQLGRSPEFFQCLLSR